MTPTPLADDLIAEALACPCDTRPGPHADYYPCDTQQDLLCARCECLVELVQAIDTWQAEQVSGLPWEQIAQQIQYPHLPPLSKPQRVWYRVIGLGMGLGMWAYYAAHCVWTFSVWSWDHWWRRNL